MFRLYNGFRVSPNISTYSNHYWLDKLYYCHYYSDLSMVFHQQLTHLHSSNLLHPFSSIFPLQHIFLFRLFLPTRNILGYCLLFPELYLCWIFSSACFLFSLVILLQCFSRLFPPLKYISTSDHFSIPSVPASFFLQSILCSILFLLQINTQFSAVLSYTLFLLTVLSIRSNFCANYLYIHQNLLY